MSSASRASKRGRVTNLKSTVITESVSAPTKSSATIPGVIGVGFPESDLSGLVDKVVNAMTSRLIETLNSLTHRKSWLSSTIYFNSKDKIEVEGSSIALKWRQNIKEYFRRWVELPKGKNDMEEYLGRKNINCTQQQLGTEIINEQNK